MKNIEYCPIKQRRWTKSAIDCYYIGCNCSKCFIFEIIGARCQMKSAVLQLVRKFGKPEKYSVYTENY